ncbi:hypothetical protein LB533_15180 [Mesorhizobium sp. BR1-1-13]|uniref:hypothetical protein n=1 Tax=Mesorhizobium sp. BR1-1-13 TaxID=2876656 RepID=UPI001CD0DE62|nr:hypothetical protein [Mesorhizobium sp. BR1-1-13]MBZ9942437.1 hypothetical protein [Mesorhizobium sp. BR1-1-13]
MIGYYDHYKGHVEMTLQEDLRSVDSITDYARRRIMVLLSGAMSEWLKEGKVDEGYAQRELQPGGRAVNDMKGVSELVRIIRNATYSVSQDAEEHQKQLDDIYKPIWRETVAFIEAEHELITNMGLSISERGQILERTLWNVRAGITCDRSYPSMASSASDAASLDFDRLACIVRDITKALRHGRVCPDVTSQDTAAPM